MANLDRYKEAARKFELKEQWPKAIEQLVKAIEEYEKSPESETDLALYNRVGDNYVKLNDTTNALQYYERAVDRYAEASLVNPAIALCNKILRLSPGRAGVYLKLGMLFAKKGFAAEAKQNLLEYADRMQKAGQIEEAFKALKKFAEMTPGQQDEIWATLAAQARAQATTPEAKEQVDKLLAEFEAKDKAAQRKSRASRSMITGETIPEEPKHRKQELIFLDIDDLPTPARKSGAKAAAPPPPPPPAPEPEPEPLEIETTSLAPETPPPESPAAEMPLLDIEPTSAIEEARPSAVESSTLGLEPTAFEEPPPAAEPASLGLEPTAFEAPAPAAPEPDLLGLEPLPGEVPVAEPTAGLPMLDESAEPAVDLPLMDLAEPAAPATELPLLDVGEAAAPDAVLPPLDTGEVETESEAAQKLEFLDLGEVKAPQAPSAADLEARVAADASDWGAHRELGEALLEQGDRDRGLAELDASLVGYDQADSLPEAVALVEEILRLDPNSIRHQQKRVELAYRQGDRSRLVEAYVELADALLRSDAPDKSIAVYQRVLEHDPENLRAKSALETLVPPAPPAPAPAAPASPAKPAAQRPAAAPPVVPEGGYVDLGSFLFDEEGPKDTRMRIEDEEPTGDEQKDFQQMLAAFKKGIESNVEEEDFESHYDLGVAYKEMGLLDEAIAEFQKALRSTEGRLRSSEALGLCFFEKGQFAVAETIMRRGLDLPANGDAERVGLLYWLGRTCQEQGKGADALAAYNRVSAVDIKFMDVNDRVRELTRAGSH
jgi:tetratricopeptide (TPR) repeat protein